MPEVSIDSIKATLTRRGGIARGNRFGVHIAHPLRSKNEQMYKAAGPFDYLQNEERPITGPKLSEEIDNWTQYIQDGRDTYMLCTNVTLPGKRITTTEAAHNHHLSKKPYSMATDEVSMSFLLTSDWYMKKYFDAWMELVIDSSGAHYKTTYKDEYTADVDIQALYGNVTNQIGYGIKLENAYPIQMSAVELGNDQEGLMSVTITWEYDNWRLLDMEEGMEVREEEHAVPPGEPKPQKMPTIEPAIPVGEPRVQDLSTTGGPPDFGPVQAIPWGEPKKGQAHELANQARQQHAIPHGQPRGQNLDASRQGGPPDFRTRPAIPFGQPSGNQVANIQNKQRQPAIGHGRPRVQDIPQASAPVPPRRKRVFKWMWRI